VAPVENWDRCIICFTASIRPESGVDRISREAGSARPGRVDDRRYVDNTLDMPSQETARVVHRRARQAVAAIVYVSRDVEAAPSNGPPASPAGQLRQLGDRRSMPLTSMGSRARCLPEGGRERGPRAPEELHDPSTEGVFFVRRATGVGGGIEAPHGAGRGAVQIVGGQLHARNRPVEWHPTARSAPGGGAQYGGSRRDDVRPRHVGNRATCPEGRQSRHYGRVRSTLTTGKVPMRREVSSGRCSSRRNVSWSGNRRFSSASGNRFVRRRPRSPHDRNADSPSGRLPWAWKRGASAGDPLDMPPARFSRCKTERWFFLKSRMNSWRSPSGSVVVLTTNGSLAPAAAPGRPHRRCRVVARVWTNASSAPSFSRPLASACPK